MMLFGHQFIILVWQASFKISFCYLIVLLLSSCFYYIHVSIMLLSYSVINYFLLFLEDHELLSFFLKYNVPFKNHLLRWNVSCCAVSFHLAHVWAAMLTLWRCNGLEWFLLGTPVTLYLLPLEDWIFPTLSTFFGLRAHVGRRVG